VYSARLHVYTRASLTDILARKIALVGQLGGQVGEDPRACPARTNGQHYGSWLPVIPVASCGWTDDTDILATILAKMSVSVSLSVSVPWNSSFTEAGPLVKLNNYKYDNLFFLHCYALFLSTYSVTFRKSFFQICFHLSPVSYRHLLPTASKTS